ncbi:sodium nucleoside cotransporter [Pyrenophora seminiperda CCB06]|uniref:Sodium nucleoside cotransporter n=1 Tax=Pyrenophora seminiperda CCB06 TaxID=1302712 RepID=A0A3M7MAM5_9PLEO|nr:sodium nucleoside cotransporter [Pyrenophora seminiperda CCB06]
MSTSSNTEDPSEPTRSPGTDTYVTVTAANTTAIPSLPNGSEPNISVREYIYFLPYPLPPGTEVPYSIHLPEKNPLNLPTHQLEPTDTLVLTSPKRTFVDIRIYKPFNAAEDLPPPANVLEPQRLEWAFAGTSSSRSITLSPTGPKHGKSQIRMEKDMWSNVTHSKWSHWIDSRYTVGSKDIPVDEGDMYPIAPDLTLEVGHAFHPALNAEKTHEEMWRDVHAISTNEAPHTTKLCVVLRCKAEHAGVRGLIVRVGQYCQGIVMERDRVTVERWEWHADLAGKTEREKWARSVRIGNSFLPCSAAFRAEVLGAGAVVRFHEYEWVVEELWEWK